MRSLIFFVVLFLFRPSHGSLTLSEYGLGYGILNSGMLQESVGDNGKSSLLGSFTYHFLSAHITWQGPLYQYGLRLAYTLLPRTTADDAAKITQLVFSPTFGVPLKPNLTWTSGLGILVTTSKGQGGSVFLNNAGSVSEFFRPSDTNQSTLLNIETGLKYDLESSWYVSGEFFFNGLLGEKRNMSLFLTIGYTWGMAGYSGAPQGGYE